MFPTIFLFFFHLIRQLITNKRRKCLYSADISENLCKYTEPTGAVYNQHFLLIRLHRAKFLAQNIGKKANPILKVEIIKITPQTICDYSS